MFPIRSLACSTCSFTPLIFYAKACSSIEKKRYAFQSYYPHLNVLINSHAKNWRSIYLVSSWMIFNNVENIPPSIPFYLILSSKLIDIWFPCQILLCIDIATTSVRSKKISLQLLDQALLLFVLNSLLLIFLVLKVWAFLNVHRESMPFWKLNDIAWKTGKEFQ